MRKLLLLFLTGASLAAADLTQLSMTEFLTLSRRRNREATYARLTGEIQHRRKDREPLTMPVYFGVVINPDRIMGQLLLNGSEGYLLTQSGKSGITVVNKMPGSRGDQLGYVGVRASDLTLSFLFFPPVRELAPETVNGIVPCRVFLLEDQTQKEQVKVWISVEHAFPLRAEFFHSGEKTPFRELEASAFKQKHGLYYISKLRLEGPGWRTKIAFDDDLAVVEKVDAANPPRVLVTLEPDNK